MSNLDNEISTYKNQLDQWIKALVLPQHQPSNVEIETIISFTRETLRERSSVQLSEDAMILSQYSFFLQQKANECQTFLKWSDQVEKRILGDDRTRMVRWVRQVELRNTRIVYLTRRLEVLGQSIANLVRTRYNEGNNS